MRAAVRLSPALAVDSLGIGRSDWESVRAPSRRRLVRKVVDEGRGEALVDEVLARIAEHGLRPPTRGALASVASGLGLRLDGERLVDRARRRAPADPLA